MNRSFVLFLFAAVMLAFIFSADAASATKSKSKSKTVTKKTKSKTKTRTPPPKSKTRTPTPKRSKTRTPSPKRTKTATRATGTNDYIINLAVDATATAANNLKSQIENQLQGDLGAKSVALNTFASNKFSIQAVKASAIVTDAALTSTAAKNLLTGASYRLANLKVTSVDVVTAPSPSSARRLGVGLIGAVVGTLVAMIALVF